MTDHHTAAEHGFSVDNDQDHEPIPCVQINDRPKVHVRQVGRLPKTRCGNTLRAPNKVVDHPDVNALPLDIGRCRICFPGSAR